MSLARPGATRSPWWVACVVAGLVLVATGLLVAQRVRTVPDQRKAIAQVDVGSVPPTGSTAHRPPRTTKTSPRSHPDGPAQLTTLAAGSILRLNGAAAPITPVGTVANVMQVPLNPNVVGWWRDGVAPGAAHGTAVLVGHVNYAGVTGTLAQLPALRPGDTVTITEQHRSLRFRVAGVRTYAKAVGIPPSVFTTTGAPRLALITCGGPFDSATGNYEDNIVAYTVPE